MSVQNNVSKLMGNHKLESGKRNEASEETNESSSEDGNEDSSDNRTTFKPKVSSTPTNLISQTCRVAPFEFVD